MKTLKWVYRDGVIWIIDIDYELKYGSSIINSPYKGWYSRNWKEKELKENFIENFWWTTRGEAEESFEALVCQKTWEYIFPWDKVRVNWGKETVYINSKEDKFYTNYRHWGHKPLVPKFMADNFDIEDCFAYIMEANRIEFVAHYDWRKGKYLPDWESIMAKTKTPIYDINNIEISIGRYKIETVLKYLEDNFPEIVWNTGEGLIEWIPTLAKIRRIFIEGGCVSWGSEKGWVPFKKIKEYFNNKKTMEISADWASYSKAEVKELLKQENDRLSKLVEDYKGKITAKEKLIKTKEEEIEVRRKEVEKVREEMKELKEIKEVHKPIGRSSLWDNVILSDLNYRKLQLSWQEKIPLLLEWPSGTGKSTIVRTLAEDNETPFVEFNFNGDTTVEHLLWHKVLVGVKSSKESPMAWEDWPLTDAVRNGKVFLAHELNASSPEIQFILNGLLELKNWELGNLTVQGNNWEVIKAHANFRFYGTYNRGYLWTKSFGTSIMSRFIWTRIDPLKKEEEASLLDNKYPWNKVAINLLVKLEEVLRGKKDFTYDISTRDIEQALLFIRNWFWYRDSIEATIEQSLQIDLEKKILWEEFDRIFTS